MLKPLADRLLVKPLDEVRVTAGGIHLPDDMKHKEPVRGRAIAIGVQFLLVELIDAPAKLENAARGEDAAALSRLRGRRPDRREATPRKYHL